MRLRGARCFEEGWRGAEVESSGVTSRKVPIKSKSLNFKTGPRVNSVRLSEPCGCSFKETSKNNLHSKSSHVRKKNVVCFPLKTCLSLLNHSLWLWQLTGNFIGKCQSVSVAHRTRSLPGFLLLVAPRVDSLWTSWSTIRLWSRADGSTCRAPACLALHSGAPSSPGTVAAVGPLNSLSRSPSQVAQGG